MFNDLDDDALRRWIAENGHEFLDDFSDPDIFIKVDPRGRRRRLVLLGAGASVEAGLSVSSDLLADLRALKLRIFQTASNAAGGDVERAVQLLELVAEGDDHGTLGHALTKFGLKIDLPGTFGNVPRAVEAARELRQVRDYIRANYWLPDHANVDYLRTLVAAQRGGTIATLNYDNTLQLAGAVGFGAPETSISIVANDRHDMIRVLSLHGSIGWQHLADKGRGINVVRHCPAWQDPSDVSIEYDPAIIFGAGNKLRSYGPYLMLYSAFQACLDNARSLITIGYAWRDDHINDTIRQWATQPSPNEPNRRLLVVGVGPDSRALSGLPADLTRDHSTEVEVRVARGCASEVISELFRPGGEFGCEHIEQFRGYWCSS